MVPYYDELVKGLILPVIDKEIIDHSLDNNCLDNNFFIRYSMLFEMIEKLKSTLDNIVLDDTVLCHFNSDNKKFYFNRVKESILSLSNLNIDSLSTTNIVDLEKYLTLWGETIDSLYNLGLLEIKLDEHIKTMRLFNDSLVEIAVKRKELINKPLPDNWLITSKGYLYNTESTKHSTGHFREHYLDMNYKFLNGKLNFNRSSNDEMDLLPELNHPEIISNNGYVRSDVVDMFLQYLDYVQFNGKSFDPKYIKVITGILELELDYYKFLRRLHLYTNDPYQELNKIITLTGNNYDDVLIRCCGVSKVITPPISTIVTSETDYEREFEKYMVKGWKVHYINPLIINREKGIVEERSNSIMKIRRL